MNIIKAKQIQTNQDSANVNKFNKPVGGINLS